MDKVTLQPVLKVMTTAHTPLPPHGHVILVPAKWFAFMMAAMPCCYLITVCDIPSWIPNKQSQFRKPDCLNDYMIHITTILKMVIKLAWSYDASFYDHTDFCQKFPSRFLVINWRQNNSYCTRSLCWHIHCWKKDKMYPKKDTDNSFYGHRGISECCPML